MSFFEGLIDFLDGDPILFKLFLFLSGDKNDSCIFYSVSYLTGASTLSRLILILGLRSTKLGETRSGEDPLCFLEEF